MTDAERRLWLYLRNHRMNGYKFKRQVIIGKYIVDFVCMSKKLIIELDGGQHQSEQFKYDQQRTKDLNEAGYQVLRYWNNDVLLRLNAVLESILMALENS